MSIDSPIVMVRFVATNRGETTGIELGLPVVLSAVVRPKPRNQPAQTARETGVIDTGASQIVDDEPVATPAKDDFESRWVVCTV
jgi:hypothetical protein